VNGIVAIIFTSRLTSAYSGRSEFCGTRSPRKRMAFRFITSSRPGWQSTLGTPGTCVVPRWSRGEVEPANYGQSDPAWPLQSQPLSLITAWTAMPKYIAAAWLVSFARGILINTHPLQPGKCDKRPVLVYNIPPSQQLQAPNASIIYFYSTSVSSRAPSDANSLFKVDSWTCCTAASDSRPYHRFLLLGIQRR